MIKMNDDDKLKRYEDKLNEIDDEIDDIVENLKYMLDFNDIKDINLLNIHYELYDLLIKKDQLKNMIFNMKY